MILGSLAYTTLRTLYHKEKITLFAHCAKGIYNISPIYTSFPGFSRQSQCVNEKEYVFYDDEWNLTFLLRLNSLLLDNNLLDYIHERTPWPPFIRLEKDIQPKITILEQPCEETDWWGSEDKWKRGLRSWIDNGVL